MADAKITALTELAATPETTDILPIVDDPGGSPVTKKITVANLMAAASSGISVLDRESALITINNTVTETDIFTYSIGAGVLSTNKAVRLTIIGTSVSTSGNPTFRVRVYYGTTTLYDDSCVVLNASAETLPFTLNLLMANQDSASIQVMGGIIALGSYGNPASGYGDLGTDEIVSNTPIAGSAAENSAGALTFRVSFTWSAAAAGNTFKRQYAFLELI